ncbi:MAG: redoxin domain-containing protein [Phycisphaerae bacterium]|nr:redoxin domain-containing protein [Phycisphaerae bacterium]
MRGSLWRSGRIELARKRDDRISRRYLHGGVVAYHLLAGISMAWAAPPQVIKTDPENGAINVTSSLGEIAVTFDQDMNTGGYSWVRTGAAFPGNGQKPAWVDARTCVLPARLQPNQTYSVGINSQQFTNFRSEDGTPAVPYVLSFWTGPAGKGSKARGTPRSKRASSRTRQKLEFELPDVFGREVCGEDYVGVPVLLLSGACWCGGCQQDMHQFKALEEKYGPGGLRCIRSVAGDNELVSLEFQRHYRLPFVHLMDTTREFEKRYHRDGWPFVMVIDRTGEVVFRANNTLSRIEGDVIRAIEGAVGTTPPDEDVIRNGIRYRPATLDRSGEREKPRRRDRFPSVACGNDGRAYVTFTSDRNGNDDVFLRVFDGERWGSDVPICAAASEEFDSQVAVDSRNQVWVSWTSNDKGDRYNVFVARIQDPPAQAEAMQLTESDDDAMHARIACDRRGDVWVTYYKWHKMGAYSRDKEVYLRRYDGRTWSDEIQVSPTDVPQYEDHTDPIIACCGDGAVVCWSWDYHRPEGYTRDAANPTVFCRAIGGDLGLGQVRHLSTGQGFDASPSVVVDGRQRLWCAWERLDWDGRVGANRKSLWMVQSDRDASDTPTQTAVTGSRRNVCAPSLARSSDGKIVVVWCEREKSGTWALKMTTWEDGKGMQESARTLESGGDPRFADAAYDARGGLWVAFSRESEAGRNVVVRQVQEANR